MRIPALVLTLVVLASPAFAQTPSHLFFASIQANPDLSQPLSEPCDNKVYPDSAPGASHGWWTNHTGGWVQLRMMENFVGLSQRSIADVWFQVYLQQPGEDVLHTIWQKSWDHYAEPTGFDHTPIWSAPAGTAIWIAPDAKLLLKRRCTAFVNDRIVTKWQAGQTLSFWFTK